MATRRHTHAPNEFYHVYNRGTEKRDIFLDSGDYQRFMELLYLCNSAQEINVRNIRRGHASIYEYDRKDSIVSIGAYCLLSNHFHLLLTTNQDDGIAKFMGKVSTSYAMYFNKKYQRSGRLFQGTYQSKHADSDEYLKYLYAYIHLNPVYRNNTGVSKTVSPSTLDAASTYRYSSLRAYLGKPPERSILTPAAFPEYFNNAEDHLAELSDWLRLG